MENTDNSRALPEKVMRRHIEMLTELLPEITRLVIEEGRPADGLLSRHLRSHKELGSRDRRFLSQAVFSYLRWYGWTIQRLALSPVEACLVGAALDHTELDHSFSYLAERCRLPQPLEPLGNKDVTEKGVILSDWFKDALSSGPLEITDLVPSEFPALVDPEKIPLLIRQFQIRPPTWIRSRSEPDLLVNALHEHHVPCTAHTRLPSALSISGGVNLQSVLPSMTAQYVVQDLSSQCVAKVAAPQQEEEWWDCCAGAGGKALHLADLMAQNGRVLASDIRVTSLKELKKRARKYGIRSIRTQMHNLVRDEPLNKAFDGVLLDAPCSGWGTWGRNPDARWRTSGREVTQCAGRQVKMLNHASWCVRPGGVLVYAVCSMTRPETEEVVMHFLDQNAGFRLDPFPHPLTGESTNGQLQIEPWDGPGDAMFIARLVRIEE